MSAENGSHTEEEPRGRRSPRRIVLAAVGLAALVPVAVLLEGRDDQNREKQDRAVRTLLALPGPQGDTPQELADSIRHLSRRARALTDEIGREGTVPDSFCEHTSGDPRDMYSASPPRVIVDSLCQPPLGMPNGVYTESTFDSPKVGEVRDGDVLRAECIDPSGQFTSNVTGDGSEVWLKVVVPEGGSGYMPAANVAFAGSSVLERC